jgi:hypothetical protein
MPASVSKYYFRGDAACYEHELLNWLREEKREGGPEGFIGFAVSTPMNPVWRRRSRARPRRAGNCTARMRAR